MIRRRFLQLLGTVSGTTVLLGDGIGRVAATNHQASAADTSVVDGFESGAYDDSNPTTWEVYSPGEYIEVRDGIVKNGNYALEMRSGETNDNHAKLYHHAEDGTLQDGDVLSSWIRTDGRAFYRLGTGPSASGPHHIQAGIFTDHNKLRIQTNDGEGNTISDHSFGTPATGEWYRFEMEMYPSQSELIGRVYDGSERLLGEQRLTTSGRANLSYTTLHVPTPFGRQDTGWFDDVTVVSSSDTTHTEPSEDSDGQLAVDGFENGSVEGWTLLGETSGTLTAEQSDRMAGSWVASLQADGSGSKNQLRAYREFDGTLTPGMTLQSWVSFSHEDSHIPKIRYVDSSETTNSFHVRFDPPINNVWLHASHGDQTNRVNFASEGATNTVYKIELDLQDDSIRCRLLDRTGDGLALAVVEHPPGFTYDTIDRVVVDSQDETPIDIRFDEITYPTTAGESAASSLRTITYGETKQGEIDEDDPRDTYYTGNFYAEPVTFEGSRGDSIAVETSPGSLSGTWVRLEGPEGNTVAQKGNANDTTTLETTLDSSGEYTIWVSSYESGATGTYELALSTTNALEGTVTGPSDEPLPGATIHIYDAEGSAQNTVATTTANSEGEFQFNNFAEPTKSAILAIDEERDIFDVKGPFDDISSLDNPDLSLNKQLLFGPTTANDHTIVTVWRRFEPDRRQAILIELTDLNQCGEQWKIDTHTRSDTTDQAVMGPGKFSLIVPETDIEVSYDDITLYRAPNRELATQDGGGMQRWHPSLTNVPSFEFASITDPSPPYSILTDEKMKDYANTKQYVNLWVDTFPIVSDVANLVDIVSFAESATDSDGPDITTAAGDNVRAARENTEDTVRQFWNIWPSSSIVCEIPLQFNTDTNLSFVTECTWHASPDECRVGSSVGDRYRFGTTFDIGATL